MWEALSCATGSAADLPAHLAALGSPDRPTALAALGAVRERLFRDGAVYEAAAAAVPLLIERARDPAGLVRPPILQLLAFLHGGESPAELALRRSGEAGDGDAALAARVRVERDWVLAARTAVRRALHDFLALLTDPDRDVRVAAACLVTAFRDPGAEADVRMALGRRVRAEPDEVVRATLVGSLNVHLPRSHLELYDTLLERDPSLLVRREAAHSLAVIERADTPKLAVATLLEAVLHARELEPLYAGVAWNRRGLVADSMWALLQLGPAATRPLLGLLGKLVRRSAPADALAIAEVALLVAFEAPSAGRAYGDLAPDQLGLLRTLADTGGLFGPELSRMLAYYGLPREPEALRAFVSRS